MLDGLVAGLAAASAVLLLGAGSGPRSRWTPPHFTDEAVSLPAAPDRDDTAGLLRLLGAVLAAGAPPGSALDAVCAALPGQAAERLAPIRSRLLLGADPDRAWALLARDPDFAPLGRAVQRALRSGAPVAAAVGHLADELAEREQAAIEERARAVGVKAALPLGLCLL
ncbi:MAG: type II secretion system F family protein, partial [Nocardioides sp.]